MPILTGIGLGLAVAFLQAITYILSKNYYNKTQTGTLTLLSLSHIQMGLGALLLLIFIWPKHAALDYGKLFQLTSAVALPYFLGQAAFLWALKTLSPSRLTPLITFKIVIIALESMLFFNTALGSLRWLGIGLCTLAMFIFYLPEKGSRFGLSAIIPASITVICYANSDLAAAQLGAYLYSLNINYASLFGTCLYYLLTGVLGMSLLFILKDNPWQLRLWKYAAPYAVIWFVSIILLFQTFLFVGPILGTMLQSVRGIISVLLGAILASRGFVTIEEKTTRGIFLCRLLTTVFMTIGIGIYLWST